MDDAAADGVRDIEATATHLTLRALARAPPVAESSPPRRSFMQPFNRALFGSDKEPSWDDLRDGARRNLLGAEGVDPHAAAQIWEQNQALPPELRRTSPELLKEFSMDAAQLEQRTAALPGPKITKEQVLAAITRAAYYHFPGTTQTVCCLELTNGFTVVGSSACADPANFDEELGRDLAYDDAVNEVWHLLGFRLREQLYQSRLSVAAGQVGGLTPVAQLGSASEPPAAG
jgi:Phage protein (N4 Gp49/phage Sf6 gene 66) family